MSALGHLLLSGVETLTFQSLAVLTPSRMPNLSTDGSMSVTGPAAFKKKAVTGNQVRKKTMLLMNIQKAGLCQWRP